MLGQGWAPRAVPEGGKTRSLPSSAFQAVEEARHLHLLLSSPAVASGYYKAGGPESHGSTSKTLGERGYCAHTTEEQSEP